MISILLTIINIIFVILIILPLRILLRIVQKIDNKRASAQLKRYQIDYQLGQEIIQQYKEEDRTLEMKSVQLKLKAKIISLKTRIKLRKGTIRFLRFLLTLFQVSSVFSGVFISILVGIAVLVSLNMSTLIPVWQLSLGNSQQTTPKSDDSDAKPDDSSSSKETGTAKAPNTAVTVFLYMMKNVKNMTPESASAYVGNMMMESGGGTYNLDPAIHEIGGGGGYGLVQWTYYTRKDPLMAKPHPELLKTQLEYIKYELNGAYASTVTHANQAPDLVTKARVVADEYEQPREDLRNIRGAPTKKFYDDFVKDDKWKKYKLEI